MDGTIDDSFKSNLEGYLLNPTIHKVSGDRFFVFANDNNTEALYIYGSDNLQYGDKYDWTSTPKGNATGIVEQPDGKVIVSVSIEGQPEILAWKFSQNGTYDESFGEGGVLIDKDSDFPGSKSIAIQGDNQLLFAGSGIVKRYNNYIETNIKTSDRNETYGREPFHFLSESNCSGVITYTNITESVISINKVNGEVTVESSGTAQIQATQDQWGGYLPTTSFFKTVIDKATLTATAENKSRVFGKENPELTILYTGFEYEDNENDIFAPVVSTNARMNSNTGTYSIMIGGGSAENYTINLIDGSLTIEKANQLLHISAIPEKTFGDEPFAIHAEASSGLPLTFEMVSGPASISANNISLTGAGSVQIKIIQSGNENYLENSESIRFCSNPSKPTIIYNSDDSELVCSSNLGIQWFLDGEELPGETHQNIKVNLSGTYSAQSTIDGCSNMSEPIEIDHVVTSIIEKKDQELNLSLYPNPASNLLFIKLNVRITQGNLLSVYNLLGTKIISKELVPNDDVVHAELDVSEFPNGIYLVSIQEGEKLLIQKFIKE